MPKHFQLPSLVILAMLGASLLPLTAHAQNLTAEQGRAAVAPFYDALNAALGKDAAALVMQATTADWVSCSGQDDCKPLEKVVPMIAGFGKAIPDLKWGNQRATDKRQPSDRAGRGLWNTRGSLHGGTARRQEFSHHVD